MSELVANEDIPAAAGDPRTAAALAKPLVSEEHMAVDGGKPRAVLVHSTRSSKLRLAAAMSHDIHGPERKAIQSESFPDLGRLMIAAEVPGRRRAPHRQVRRLRLVRRAVKARPGRPGQRRASRPPS